MYTPTKQTSFVEIKRPVVKLWKVVWFQLFYKHADVNKVKYEESVVKEKKAITHRNHQKEVSNQLPRCARHWSLKIQRLWKKRLKE